MISPHESTSRRQISKLRSQKRVEKTILDYLVAALNPLLIMLLVGSLVFFLIQVFYRGEMAGGVRWVMFWFVLAVVLVSRIGIEQSPIHAGVYGAGLAAAAWLFLLQTHPAFLLGIVCLAVVWWSAHQLVQDCTLIDDDQDFTHQGLLQNTTGRPAKRMQATSSQPSQNLASGKAADLLQKQKSKSRRINRKKDNRAARPPGRRVLSFSLAALPLFGLGQWFAAARNPDAGQPGFPFLVAYFAAACGLLLSTSFLGMRRYLRQRSVKMPGNIAGSWMFFGAGIGGFVLLLSVFAPRPGAGAAWMEFSGKIDSLIQNASETAMRFNPAGIGKGQEVRDSVASRNDVQNAENPRSPNADPQSQSGKQPQLSNQGRPENSADTQADSLARILKRLLIAAACIAAVVFLCRKRKLLAALIASFWRAIAGFFRNLLTTSLRPSVSPGKPAGAAKKNPSAPFRRFQDPFASGRAERWPPEVLIAYSYEALQSWAKEAGAPDSPEETPVERSRSLARRHPALYPWVLSLGEHYSLLAYGERLPRTTDTRSLRKIWATITVPIPKAPGILDKRNTTAPRSSSPNIESI